jgi:IclR family transcriptional regulator, KDG regulon repressor
MSKRENISIQRKSLVGNDQSAVGTTQLRRATEILSCLSLDINTVTDIAVYCLYNVSTVHRVLQTLKGLNWVIQDDNNHKYYLGPMVTQLAANRIASHKYLIMHSIREMERLAKVTEESVNLGVMVQMHYTLLYEISSLHNLRITEESKRLIQLFTGATAKVLFSQLNDDELVEALTRLKFDAITEYTIVDKKLLLKQIKEIRQKGYCITRGERIPGAVCIAAPIPQYMYPVSLGIVGPEERLKNRADDIVKELLASVNRISQNIAGALQGGGDM